MGKIIEIDTGSIKQPKTEGTIYEVRESFAESTDTGSEVTVIVQAYNGLEKTKNCIESLLKYTNDVDYDLWLIDNGSTDGTFEYFKTVEYEKKNILHLSENKGSPLPWSYMDFGMLSRYVCLVNNDLVLTKNWLSNLLIVMKSDKKIGMVNPMSSNASNFQDPKLEFTGYDDMQRKAEAFNVSDPKKWEERIRLITLGSLFRKECLYAIGLPLFDVGFTHNFGDDDVAFRVRRAGYKAVLAGDTWIHHDDEKLKCVSPERASVILKDMDEGRKKFMEKYFGVDAWSNDNYVIPEYINNFVMPDDENGIKVLGIDPGYGTPLLEIKNHLRRLGVFDADCYAYTEDAKTVIDLQTVCGPDRVICGEIKGLSENYPDTLFSHIIIGKDINSYYDPIRVVKNTAKLLSPGGQLFIKMYNTHNYKALLNMIGRTCTNDRHALNYTVEEFVGKLKKSGLSVLFAGRRPFEGVKKEDEEIIKYLIDKIPVKDKDEALFRLFSESFCLVVTG